MPCGPRGSPRNSKRPSVGCGRSAAREPSRRTTAYGNGRPLRPVTIPRITPDGGGARVPRCRGARRLQPLRGQKSGATAADVERLKTCASSRQDEIDAGTFVAPVDLNRLRLGQSCGAGVVGLHRGRVHREPSAPERPNLRRPDRHDRDAERAGGQPADAVLAAIVRARRRHDRGRPAVSTNTAAETTGSPNSSMIRPEMAAPRRSLISTPSVPAADGDLPAGEARLRGDDVVAAWRNRKREASVALADGDDAILAAREVENHAGIGHRIAGVVGDDAAGDGGLRLRSGPRGHEQEERQNRVLHGGSDEPDRRLDVSILA